MLDAIAPVFASNWDIREAVRSILLRPEFYSVTAREGLVRSPIDYITAVMIQTGFRAERLNPQWFVEGMGQVPFGPPNVSGWRPNGAWINAAAMGVRADFAQNTTWKLRDKNLPENAVRGDMSSLTKLTIDGAIDKVASMFGLGTLSATTRAGMTEFLVAQRAAEKWGGWSEPTLLLNMVMIAPEMHVA